jgi:hypothetical protein
MAVVAVPGDMDAEPTEAGSMAPLALPPLYVHKPRL